MDKNWSDMNKEMQTLISKEATFAEGINKLIEMRDSVFEQITQIVKTYPVKAFSEMPYPKASGYHSKTLAYSIWHIFRIEDIVAHELIKNDEQILFKYDFISKVRSPIITTGNELQGEEIAEFSGKLDIQALYEYAQAVKLSTEEILKELTFKDTKRKFTGEDRQKLIDTKCVSEDENAFWLIDYWCGKNLAGLIKMPFSRHHIMHVEAMRRIKNRLCELARKGVNPIAYCGFSCNHCFMGEWCGSCRTEYNACSFGTLFPDNKCPNVSCCQEKGLDGCYECDKLENCEVGFYSPTVGGCHDAKSSAMYIKKHGKKEFMKVHDRLKEKYSFEEIQANCGKSVEDALSFLEAN
ncbi:MAG: DUF3795 domain-containing protein [Clostridia bacterium]|nr:DUF3795 domain-containing protein [Clostridia bacterium]